MVIAIVQGAPADRDEIASILRRTPPKLADGITESQVAAAVRARQWAWWLDQEPPLTQARTLGLAATLGNVEEATLLPEHLRVLTADDIRTAARGVFNK
jgi:hypothetical protein